jgi:hypothetical protein
MTPQPRDHHGSTYRAAWIEATGELYSVRHGGPRNLGRVTVLARMSADALDHELDGWRAACDADEPGTYEWLVRQTAAVEKRSRLPAAEPA